MRHTLSKKIIKRLGIEPTKNIEGASELCIRRLYMGEDKELYDLEDILNSMLDKLNR